jgi:NADH:ubiquinone oxidoreductase subunit 4 (subunit M)
MRELVIAVPLVVFAVVLGVYPQSLLNYMQPSVDRQIDTLTAWTERNDAQRESLRRTLDEDEEQVAAMGQ